MFQLFATCQGGLEEALKEELLGFGMQDVELSFHGVRFTAADFKALIRINYRSFLASKILMPLLKISCFQAQDLYEAIRKYDWIPFFAKGRTLAIDVTGTHPVFQNTLYAAQLAKDAICDGVRQVTGRRPCVDLHDPDVRLSLFLEKGRATLSFDTSGQPLYKRGYRRTTGPAPLQESLAAGLLKLTGFEPGSPFFDPCCGSGTLLMEAALMTTKTPAGFFRQRFGFMFHPEYETRFWLEEKREADAKRLPLPEGVIAGIDSDPEILFRCQENFKQAGLDKVRLEVADFREYEPLLSPTYVITNPPHGKRLGNEEKWVSLYRALGDFLKRKTAKPAKAGVFTTSPLLAKQVGLRAKRRFPLKTSGLEARLLTFDLF